MQALLKFFIDLAFLRRAPQDLPASSSLLALFAIVSIVLGVANGAQMFGGIRAALGANLLDLALTLGFVYALLALTGRPARWLQTATAFIGLGVLADLVVAIWLHVALGSVMRHALDLPLLAGVLIVLSYTVMAFSLIVRIFPLVGAT
jgi:hypothetical protein